MSGDARGRVVLCKDGQIDLTAISLEDDVALRRLALLLADTELELEELIVAVWYRMREVQNGVRGDILGSTLRRMQGSMRQESRIQGREIWRREIRGGQLERERNRREGGMEDGANEEEGRWMVDNGEREGICMFCE